MSIIFQSHKIALQSYRKEIITRKSSIRIPDSDQSNIYIFKMLIIIFLKKNQRFFHN